MFFRLSFVTLILALVALGTPVKRDAAKVKLDIESLTTESESLDQSIKAFPNSGGTFTQALAIHQATTTLANSVKTTTSDLDASPKFADEDANAILKLMDTFVPVVQMSCNDLVAKKDAVSNVALGAEIARKDLQTLQADSNAFSEALLLKLPAGAQKDAQMQLNEIAVALDTAMDVYKST